MGLGARITSPGALIAWAMLAKPSLEPSVATTCVSGIELHPEAALVISGLRLAQAGNAARRRIAVSARAGDRLDELVDNVLGRRHVRVAHAEINDVGSPVAGGGLQLVDLFEDVRRQTFDAMKLVHRVCHSGPLPLAPPQRVPAG